MAKYLALQVALSLMVGCAVHGQDTTSRPTRDANEIVQYLLKPRNDMHSQIVRDYQDAMRSDPARFVAAVNLATQLPPRARDVPMPDATRRQVPQVTAMMSLVPLLGPQHGGSVVRTFSEQAKKLAIEARAEAKSAPLRTGGKVDADGGDLGNKESAARTRMCEWLAYGLPVSVAETIKSRVLEADVLERLRSGAEDEFVRTELQYLESIAEQSPGLVAQLQVIRLAPVTNAKNRAVIERELPNIEAASKGARRPSPPQDTGGRATVPLKDKGSQPNGTAPPK